MLKIGEWKERLVNDIQLPCDLAYSDSMVLLKGGREVVIENYKSLLTLNEQEIGIRLKKGRLTVCGEGLHIPVYTTEEMRISGTICRIIIEGR